MVELWTGWHNNQYILDGDICGDIEHIRGEVIGFGLDTKECSPAYKANIYESDKSGKIFISFEDAKKYVEQVVSQSIRN